LAAVAVLGFTVAAPAQQIPLPGSEPSAPPASTAPRAAPGNADRIPVPGLQQTSPAPSPERQINLPAAAQQPPDAPAGAPAPSRPASTVPAVPPAAVAPPAPSVPERAAAIPAAESQGNALAPAVQAPGMRLPLVPVEGTSGLRLSGERVAARFALIAPPLGSGDGATLSLVHLSGADLLPERSHLDVSLNDKPIGTLEPDAFVGPGEASLPIPAGLLRSGRNLVTISGQATHRVLCGPGAGFDLWTQLDPDRSGIVLPAKNLGAVSDLSGFIDAVAAATARGEAIPVSLRVPLTPDAISTLVSVATLLGRTMPEVSPSFDVGLGGMDVAGRPRIVLAGGSDAATVRQAADGAPILLLQGAPGPLLSRQQAGARALAGQRPPVIERRQSVTLAGLGLGDVPITEHRRQVDAVLRLPADFLVSNDSVARLRLMLAYDGGLPAGAGMTLSLNGTALAMRPFGQSGGEVIENEEYQLPLRLFHAGENTVRFDFSVPAQLPQQACPETSGDRPFATLFGDTSLTLDDSPHMVALPDLSLTTASGYPYDGSGPARLFLADLDPRTVGAALTVVARLSAISDDPVQFQPTLSLAAAPGPVLAVGAVTALPSGLFADAPLSPAAIAPHLAAQDLPAVPSIAVPPGAGQTSDAARIDSSADARLAWQAQLDQRASRDTIVDQASSFWDGMLQDARDLVGWRDAGPSVPDWLATQKIQGSGFIGQWQGAGGLVTLVTAADPQALSAFASRATRSPAWSALDGDAALLLADGWTLHQPAEQSLVMTKPFLSANMLMVAGHWFSRNGTLWTIAVLALSVIAAAVTRLLLGRLGVRRTR
jgi:hypothetical protein